jgi:radical SAM protein with 4Fe4S-binding SPASM domain
MKPNSGTINSSAWIDEFIGKVRPYIFVRTEDNILIKRPNQATKINASGAKIMQFLLNGGTYSALLDKTGHDKAQEIEMFMLAIKSYLEGNIDEFTTNPAVETSPFTMHFSKLPVLSELALTYKCNLKCRFCYAGCNCTTNPAQSDKELSLTEFKKVIRTIFEEARVPSISFTGGEPTLRPEILMECIKYAKSLGMRVNLITNGTLIDKAYGNKLMLAGLDSAQVSIEGVTPGIHDKLVQHQGAFIKSIGAIAVFKELGIHVHCNTTLNRMNADECLLMPEFVKETLGLERFSMNLVIPTGSSVLNDDLVIKYSEVGAIISEIQASSRKYNVEFMWYSPIPMCMFNTIINELGNKGCAACDGLLSVAPNGDILPCASYDQPVGNLLNKSFPDIWQGEEAVYFRNKSFAHEKCQSCDQLALCNGGCPLYWRNIGYKELKLT